MKTALKLLTLIVALTTMGSCSQELDNYNHRNIVYFIDNDEYHASLETEAEWDQLLDKLLDCAYGGSTVMFYNADRHTAKGVGAKGDVVYHTRDRKKMKEWCKKMEGEGMTVTITYDKQSGEWNGVASKGKKTNEH